jgi:hypothetical protein
MSRSSLALLLAFTVASVAAGCKSDPSAVSEGQLATARESAASLSPGMPKEEALGVFKKAAQHRLSASVVNGVSVEEYKIEAQHDQDLMIRFLYFVDGRLVEISDRRVDYKADPLVAERWRAAAPRP